jgi:hypothetical protein
MTFISKMIFKVTGCAALLIISQACSSPSHKSSDGTSVVYSGGDSKSGYHLHAFEEKTLPNGLRILYIPDNSLPYVSFSILVRSGSAQDPKGQEGLSMMVAELLNKGTTKRSATQIATDLGNMGAEFDANAAYDYSIISASSLSPQANQLLSKSRRLRLFQTPRSNALASKRWQASLAFLTTPKSSLTSHLHRTFTPTTLTAGRQWGR